MSFTVRVEELNTDGHGFHGRTRIERDDQSFRHPFRPLKSVANSSSVLNRFHGLNGLKIVPPSVPSVIIRSQFFLCQLYAAPRLLDSENDRVFVTIDFTQGGIVGRGVEEALVIQVTEDELRPEAVTDGRAGQHDPAAGDVHPFVV